MQEIIEIVLKNLYNVGLGCALFLIAYLSNVCLSLWYNIKMCNQEFDWKRLLSSVLKILAFGAGTSLLVIGITLVPIFADFVGFNIPEEYSEVLQNIAIIATFIVSACKYLIEAFGKFKKIIGLEKQ